MSNIDWVGFYREVPIRNLQGKSFVKYTMIKEEDGRYVFTFFSPYYHTSFVCWEKDWDERIATCAVEDFESLLAFLIDHHANISFAVKSLEKESERVISRNFREGIL